MLLLPSFLYFVIVLDFSRSLILIIGELNTCDVYRLAGAVLIAPAINYWWPGFPSNLSREAYYEQLPQDQWAVRVAHYIPWLVHWWNTQKLFPGSSVIAGKPMFSRQDLEHLPKLGNMLPSKVLFFSTTL